MAHFKSAFWFHICICYCYKLFYTPSSICPQTPILSSALPFTH